MKESPTKSQRERLKCESTRHASKNSLKQTQRAASHLPSQKCSAEAPGQGRACCQRNLFLFFPSSHSLSTPYFSPPTPHPSLLCVKLQGCYAETGILTALWEVSILLFWLCGRESCRKGGERERKRERDWSGASTTFIIQLKLSGGQKEDGWHLVVRAEMYIKTVKLQTFFISVGVLVLFDYILLFFTSFGNSCSWS